ncbi:hypothetical protein [Desulfosporosinus hippei]|uniref:Uncharacterized protein n=1 Tax=Desulfosporosinus hippei DSM 8344 TaxID=1121419 RepID=A0A1G8BCV2_9FIRM|nr:hypothetical protein [Desulfosporosinus hippei]SDH31055.1 hypothetical protein SAMN05443529_1126 [Desulfosporosinus hippei DSM 8344]
MARNLLSLRSIEETYLSSTLEQPYIYGLKKQSTLQVETIHVAADKGYDDKDEIEAA